uniref:Uncharacterized protein n=1 Tax=Mycena chlorophos TaxID=658473 RepID=A0ABQ0LR38_MYCCL|nr:predicted protein [Mycena chlorophos]
MNGAVTRRVSPSMMTVNKPHPWPWAPPDPLYPRPESPPSVPFGNIWLNHDWDEADSSSDYAPSETSSESTEDSDDEDLEEEELNALREERGLVWNVVNSNWRGNEWAAQREDLPQRIARLVESERQSTAAYDPTEVARLVTEFYMLLVEMGHWEASEIRFPPHLDPPVNTQLAKQLGLEAGVIELMQRLPYLRRTVARDEARHVLARTHLADYTVEEDLRESRRRHTYARGDVPPLEPWILPLTLAGRDGWHLMLDTKIGAVRAFSTDGYGVNPDNVEYVRHPYIAPEDDDVAWTQYKRVPAVPAADYFRQLTSAYRSLERLPLVDADDNDPHTYRPSHRDWHNMPPATRNQLQLYDSQYGRKPTLLALYKEYGWPDAEIWRRSEFLVRWKRLERGFDAGETAGMSAALLG